jgi:hypothetical protein
VVTKVNFEKNNPRNKHARREETVSKDIGFILISLLGRKLLVINILLLSKGAATCQIMFADTPFFYINNKILLQESCQGKETS